MLGAIIGDIAGSAYDGSAKNPPDVELFDDYGTIGYSTVLSCAVAKSILTNDDIEEVMKAYSKRFSQIGMPAELTFWAMQGRNKLNDMDAMPSLWMSPIAHLFPNETYVLMEAGKIASLSHRNPVSIQSAQMVAVAIKKALIGYSPLEIEQFLEEHYLFDSHTSILEDYLEASDEDSLDPHVAIRCALQAHSFDEAIQMAIHIGGASPGQAAITGAIAEGLFGIPDEYVDVAFEYLPYLLKDTVAEVYRMTGRNSSAFKNRFLF